MDAGIVFRHVVMDTGLDANILSFQLNLDWHRLCIIICGHRCRNSIFICGHENRNCIINACGLWHSTKSLCLNMKMSTVTLHRHCIIMCGEWERSTILLHMDMDTGTISYVWTWAVLLHVGVLTASLYMDMSTGATLLHETIHLNSWHGIQHSTKSLHNNIHSYQLVIWYLFISFGNVIFIHIIW